MTKHKSINPDEITAAKQKINGKFPVGRFVAINNGEILADAKSHRELVEKLKTLGHSPKDLLILQAGVDYPDAALIIFNGPVPSRQDA